MNDSFQWWLIIVGIGIGIGLAWLVMGRLARHDDDLFDAERQREAAWIGRNIASYGGVASETLVEEILELHRQYLQGPPLEPAPAEPAGAPDEVTGVVAGPVTEVMRDQRAEATGSAGLRSSR